MNIQPLHKKVLIAENQSTVKSESGIILDMADSAQESSQATVLAIGPEVTLVKVGDVILPEWNKASIVNVNGYQRAIVDEDNITMVIE